MHNKPMGQSALHKLHIVLYNYAPDYVCIGKHVSMSSIFHIVYSTKRQKNEKKTYNRREKTHHQ